VWHLRADHALIQRKIRRRERPVGAQRAWLRSGDALV
jgi:hypothetical protein